MAALTSFPLQPYRLEEISGGLLAVYTLPIEPETFVDCVLCHRRGAAWRNRQKLKQHLSTAHAPVLEERFVCGRCGTAFGGLRVANAHVRGCSATQDPTPALPSHPTAAPALPAAPDLPPPPTVAAPAAAASLPGSPVPASLPSSPADVPDPTVAASLPCSAGASDPAVPAAASWPSSPVAAPDPAVPSSLPAPPATVPDPTSLAFFSAAAPDPAASPASVPGSEVSPAALAEGILLANLPSSPVAPSRTSQEEIDRLYERLVEQCRSLGSTSPSTPAAASNNTWRSSTSRRRPDFRRCIARQQQRDYRRNARSCLANILGRTNARCDLPVEEVQAAFRRRFAAPEAPIDWDALAVEVPFVEADPLARPFSAAEVDSALYGRSDSAPGPDSVVYSTLRRLPSATLQAFFNICLAHAVLPSAWREGSTILIPKERANLEDVSGWRPITLASCVYKTYAALVESRLRAWAEGHLLSPGQKGFASQDGCFEHNFTLRAVIEEARRRRRDLGVAFLDVAAAFDTLPHDAILGVLERAGLQERSLAVVAAILRGNFVRVRTAGSATDPVTMERGVRQGCPLSPLLFNCGFEVLVRAAASLCGSHGVAVGDFRSSVLAYADDLVLLARDRHHLQELMTSVESAARGIGLAFKPSKCAALLLRRGDPLADPVLLQGQRLTSLAADDSHRYLGVPMGWSLRNSPSELIARVVDDFRSVASSGLLPWQQLDAWRRFIFPQLQYALRHHVLDVQLLSSPHGRQAGDRRGLGADERLRALFRQVLQLPRTASVDYLYTAAARGGVSLPLLVEEYAITRVVDAVRALSSPGTRALALPQLRRIVSERTFTTEPSQQQLVEWLNGGPSSCPTRGSWWTSVRWAVRRLRASTDVCFELRGDRLGLSFRDPSHSAGRATLLSDATFAMVRALRASVREHHFAQWSGLRSQGRAAETLGQHSASTSFLLQGRVALCDWRFAHRARTDTLPLNAANPTTRLAGGTSCRRCGYASESLAHALQHCVPLSAARNRRHHGVVRFLADAIANTERWSVEVDRVVPGSSSNLRPDLVCRNLVTGRTIVLDVKIPFETAIAFQEADARNREKYGDLAGEISAEVWTFSIGALGSWSSKADKVLRLFQIPNSAQLRDRLLRHVLHWSRNTYVHCVTGVPQTY